MNVAALRQHIRPDERIHGIFTEAGDKPNIVPEHGRGAVVRARRRRCTRLEPLKAAGARRASRPAPRPPAARWTYEWQEPRLRRHASTTSRCSSCYAANAERARAARWSTRPASSAVVGSTDMGNVSYLVPSIHPMIKVSPPDVADPHAGVRRLRRGRPSGDQAVLDGAKAMAMTVADLWTGAGVLRPPSRGRVRPPLAGGSTRSDVDAGHRSASAASASRLARRDASTSPRSSRPTRPTSSGGTSPTSTARCSPWSTCPRS